MHHQQARCALFESTPLREYHQTLEAPERIVMRAAAQPINSILPDNPETWQGKWFLTFDLDWAADAILADTFELLTRYEIPSTVLVTHQTPLLTELRSIPSIHLGIHPNFNRLLECSQDHAGNAVDVVSRLMDVVPEARCVRSHSVVQSSRIHDVFHDFGLTHDLNTFIPSGSFNDVGPWLDWNGMVRVPYQWEDDVHCMFQASNQPEVEPVDLIQTMKRFSVVNFHPIHVFLNTESLERYEKTRPIHHDAAALIKERYTGYGTRNRLMDLLEKERHS